MKQQISQSMMVVIAIVASIGMETPTHAYSIYFGEDLGLGENTRLTSTPQADAARNSFLSNLAGSVGTQTLESFSNGSSTPLAVAFPGAGTATLNGGGFISNVSSGTNGFGRYPISENQFYDTGGNAFSLTFSQPVASFGFYGTDIGDFSGQLTLGLADNNTTETFTVPNTINGSGGSALYYGIIAQNPNEVFTSATFGNTSSGNSDVFGFDDFTIGSLEQVVTPTPVPEPPVVTPVPVPEPPVVTPAPVPEPSSVLGTLVFGALSISLVLKGKLKRKQIQQA